ncbi:DUF4430 domain-containing protein [Paenibacillus sp. 481]|uniref:DUF4430 domain-containing protein n=1 Tax=Paenibacillus sp. 481 TaxID=2835869 RepID=UPI001E5B0602|nr:DUF4430 domain-containing protein [Paenibacillus sp. 481]UHA72632.1 S-layer homology domain-containing protein [Paenibacillus sp. 481]
MKKILSLLMAASLFLTVAISAAPLHQAAAAAPSFNLNTEVQRVVKAYSAAQYDDWSAVADNVLGNTIPSTYIEQAKAAVIAEKGNYTKGTDIAKAIIGLTAAGVDITNIEGINLLDKAVNFDTNELSLSNDVVYMLLALDSGPYEVPAGAPVTRDFLIKKLLELKLPAGGWSFFGSTPNADMTGIIMAGLAPYIQQPSVSDAVYHADKFFKDKPLDNSNSAAMLVIGLSAVGKNPTADAYKQDGKNALDNLYSYLTTNGLYKYKKARATGDRMATKDVMLAYLSYQKFSNGKHNSIFYDLKSRYNTTPPQKPDPKAFDVSINVTSEKQWTGFPQSGKVTLQEGDTVDTALTKLVGADQIKYKMYGTMKYIAGIKGLESGAYGKTSGWMYWVNDQEPTVGADEYKLKAGDTVKWTYTGVDPVTNPPGNGGGGGTGGGGGGTVTPSISVSVMTEVPKSGLPISNQQTYRADMTAFDALVGLVGASNIKHKGSGESLYVSCAMDLCERANGALSGWKYSVNGTEPNESAGAYKLNNGDSIVWKYTGTPPTNTGGGVPPGGGSAGNSNSGNPSVPSTGETGNKSGTNNSNNSNKDGKPASGSKSTTDQGNGKNTDANSAAVTVTEHLSKYSDRNQISPWAKEAVARAKQLGILEGTKNKDGTVTFQPKKEITRAEFLKIVVKLLYGDVNVTSKTEYKDVKTKDWYYPYIVKAKEIGMISGFADNSFKPNEAITREQAAIILGKGFKLTAKKTVSLKDVSKQHPAALYIAAVHENGLMTDSSGKFNPSQKVSREMAAVLAVKLHDTYVTNK